MEAKHADTRSTTVAAAVGLALALGAALALAVGDAVGFLSPSAEAVFTLSVIAGWALLGWAAIVGGVVAIHLIRAVAARHRPALVQTVLVAATAVIIAGVIWAHPLVGSGGGAG